MPLLTKVAFALILSLAGTCGDPAFRLAESSVVPNDCPSRDIDHLVSPISSLVAISAFDDPDAAVEPDEDGSKALDLDEGFGLVLMTSVAARRTGVLAEVSSTIPRLLISGRFRC